MLQFGMGTTQTSIQAGTPVIITPVLADQFDIAAHVTAIKCGLGATILATVTAQELSKCIVDVVGNPEMKENCMRVAAQMSGEDGAGNTVAAIEAYHRDEVATGKFAKEYAAWKERKFELYRKNVWLPTPKAQAWFSNAAREKFPSLKEYTARSHVVFGVMARLVPEGKLWYVKCSTCLAREAEALKSREVGRFRESCLVEQVELKGNRIHVRRIYGVGPDEGWVTHTLKDNTVVLKKVTEVMEILQVQQEDIEKQLRT